MNMTEMGAKLSLVKKTIPIMCALLFLAPATAVAASDKFSDSQTTLSYSVYKPSNTLGLKTSKFSLLQCLPDEQDWLFVQYGGTVRYLQIMQTMGGVKCSDPGLSKYLRAALVNGNKAKVYAYCDPTQMSLAAYKRCGTEDIARVGGYLIYTTKAVKPYASTEIQVQGFGGITYAQLLAVAKGLKTVKASGRPLAQVLPPIMIDPLTTTDVSVRAGSSIVLTVADPAKWSAEVMIAGVVSFVPGGEQGGFITNPSFKALSAGATTVKLVNSDDPTKIYQLEITVNP
ncbi:MAG: hypothetical protein RL690_697 [Actinomycetota bacterium]